MKSKYIKLIGAVILLLSIAGIVVYQYYQGTKPEEAQLMGYLGGEKIGIFEDEEIKEYIEKKYGLTLKYQKAGSYEMINMPHEGMNYLFPASQNALEVYQRQTDTTPKNDIIYNTPIVLYSEKIIVDALEEKEVVFEEEGVYYVDMAKLVKLMIDGTKWTDLGLKRINKSIVIHSTEPGTSNSGTMLAALVANTLNDGKVVSLEDVDKILPDMKKIYEKFGFMETSSSDMFNQFLSKGAGSYPLVAGYENQLLDFAVANPGKWENMKDNIVILYPTPTLWSTHVYIALDEIGQRGMEAFLDDKVQELSWSKHGFRTGANAAQTTDQFNVNGVAPSILSVAEIPSDAVMDELISKLGFN